MDPTPTTGATPTDSNHAVVHYNARLGVAMFLVYFALYAGFILITTFKYEWMAHQVTAGLNLAIVYGMILIIAAVVMAIVYMLLCKRDV
jgi:uncharacterized membrane protein (DUF485 family)